MSHERRLWGAFGLLALAVVLAWANSLLVPFVYDDRLEVVGNRTIQDLSQWQLILGYNLSRPITIGSYALNHAVHGEQVLGFHLVNVVLQVLNAGLALIAGRALAKLGGHARPLWVGGLAAALWALHPLATESVTYIAGRSELLAGGFVLLGLWAWSRWLAQGERALAALAWACAALGVLCKESAVVLPALMLATEWLLAREGQGKQVKWLSYWPGVAGLALFFGARIWVYGSMTSLAEPLRPLSVQIPTQGVAWWLYAKLTLLPIGQSLFHGLPERGWDGVAIGAALSWLALGIAALTQVKRRPVLLFVLLWWALCLAPSSSVVALKETFAEHRSYLALLGPALALAWAVSSWEKPVGRWASLGLCVVLMGATHLRNRVWSSEVSLWQDAVDKNPVSAEAWYALGDARRLAKDPQGARKAYKSAIRVNPQYAQAWNNLGLLEVELGGWDAAEDAWKQALIQDTSYCPAHNNLGKLYGEQGRYQLAAVELNTTLSKCPRDCTAHRLLGELYQDRLRDKRLAVMHYEAYLEICPSESWSPEIRERLTRLTW